MMTETQADALAAFLRANKGKLHANAYQITGNRPDADELVQITACKLAENWADMRPEPLNWALTAMQNAWKDERKSARRRLTVSMDARGEDDELALSERLADPAQAPRPTPAPSTSPSASARPWEASALATGRSWRSVAWKRCPTRRWRVCLTP
jgi:DNA-directed RNA polymerase specialized sigma24 family protein